MKPYLAYILTAVLFLGLIGCAKEPAVPELPQTQIADGAGEPEPQPEAEPEAVSEPEPAPQAEPQSPPTAELREKLRRTNICSCLALEQVRWKLEQWGVSGYDGQVIEGVMAAFDGYLQENYEALCGAYGDLLRSLHARGDEQSGEFPSKYS